MQIWPLPCPDALLDMHHCSLLSSPLRASLQIAMLPRAYKGHLWYKEKFGKDFPKDRKIVIPGVL